MKRVAIIGFGMSIDTLTIKAHKLISQADVIIGSERLLNQLENINKKRFAEFMPQKVAEIIENNEGALFCVIVSGDVGFYSSADSLLSELNGYSVALIPGISSVNYFFSMIKHPWQNSALISCHGRNSNIIEAVRRNKLTFVLTGGNIQQIGENIVNAGFGELKAYIGENLGMADERVYNMPVSELCTADIGNLSVLLIENPGFENRVRFGIPDDEFIRGNVPMTKSEVRAVLMSRLNIRPDDVCIDIGSGTGSVTVEMALAAYEGTVHAIDKNGDAAELTKTNCRKFHIGNVNIIHDNADDALLNINHADVAFIGGSSGEIRSIFEILLSKNQNIRIAVNTVKLKSLDEAVKAFEEHGIDPEIVQINAARINQIGMLQANSPVFILCGEKKNV